MTSPWFVGGDPANGRGYESAVAAAVAKQLGYPAGAVAWTTTDPTKVVLGKASGFDVALDQFATPQGTTGPVDYSTGYFSISDSVVAKSNTGASRATGLSDLKRLRVAAFPPSTDSSTAAAQLSAAAHRYPSAAAGLAAVRSGAVDVAIVPTPLAVTAGGGLTVIGQLENPMVQPQQFGMILPKKSALTSCVSAAIDQLRVTGALKTLLQRWVPAANKPLN